MSKQRQEFSEDWLPWEKKLEFVGYPIELWIKVEHSHMTEMWSNMGEFDPGKG